MKVTVASLQLSVATKVAAVGTASHSTVTSAGAGVVKVGAVVSLILKVADEVDVFPQSSVAVKITVAGVVPHESVSEVKLLVQVTAEQLSVATAPPLDANHELKVVVFPDPSHSTSILVACVVISGAVVS